MRIRIFCMCVCATLSIISTSGTAAAPIDGRSSYPGYADVVRVEKLTRQVKRSTPVKRCHWENLPDRVEYRYGERRVTERRAKRCRTVQETRVSEQITGYDVTLNYNGTTFSRRTQTHPGVRLPVTVDISPAPHLRPQ